MSTIRRHTVRLGALIALLWAWPTAALDSLVVGMGEKNRLQDWTYVMKSSRLLSVAQDSIWMWDVEANSNLSTGIPQRAGEVSFVSAGESGNEVKAGRLEGASVLYDGDGGTALDPDEFPDLTRTASIFVDLGGTFRVNRIRFFPRLDSAGKQRFLQEFRIFTLGIPPLSPDSFDPLFAFYPSNPNAEPVVDRRFVSRDVRYILLLPTANREWEIAELEVYGDGTVPLGEYLSKPLRARSTTPVWGKVRFEGGDITRAPVVIQTRSGPDSEPELHFLKKGEQLIKVKESDWLTSLEGLKAPPKPNPLWSGWQALDEGNIRSPSLQQYLQFRVKVSEPGTVLKRLVFEYVHPPLVRDLAAELNPLEVAGGEETEFTLSMEVHLKAKYVNKKAPTYTGFRQLQVLTSAEIHAVEQVLIDDQQVGHSFTIEPGRGFTVNLWRRVVQNGSFVQVIFRGTAFRDRTRFEVRVVDRRRADDGRVETAYQLAREADVEGGPDGSLTLRLEEEEGELTLLTNVAASKAITPNGDGVNDAFILSYSLLKLVRLVPVRLEIYALNGRRVRQVYRGEKTIGTHRHAWDGRDDCGRLLAPGLYIYELRVESDREIERRHGVIGVVR